MPLIIAALLGLTGALIVAFPLLGLTGTPSASAAPDVMSDVADRERQARLALREVELDYTLGNLDSGDYDALRGRYERRALSALRTRYQREQELDALIESQLDVMRAGQPVQGQAARIASAPAPAPSRVAAPRPVSSARVTRQTARDRRASREKRGVE